MSSLFPRTNRWIVSPHFRLLIQINATNWLHLLIIKDWRWRRSDALLLFCFYSRCQLPPAVLSANAARCFHCTRSTWSMNLHWAKIEWTSSSSPLSHLGKTLQRLKRSFPAADRFKPAADSAPPNLLITPSLFDISSGCSSDVQGWWKPGRLRDLWPLPRDSWKLLQLLILHSFSSRDVY